MGNDNYGDSFYHYERKVKDKDEEVIELVNGPEDEYEEEFEEEKPFDNYEKNIKSGEYKVKEVVNHPVPTLLFFPLTIIFFELVLRFSCNLEVFTGLLYVLVFSIAFGVLLTLICTIFHKARSNRTLARILLFIITLCYEFQFINVKEYGTPINIKDFSNSIFGNVSESYTVVIDTITNHPVAICLFFIPFLLLLILGRKVFTFGHMGVVLRVVSLALMIAIICLSVLVIRTGKDEKSKITVYSAIKDNDGAYLLQNTGLLATQGIDIYDNVANLVV